MRTVITILAQHIASSHNIRDETRDQTRPDQTGLHQMGVQKKIETETEIYRRGRDSNDKGKQSRD